MKNLRIEKAEGNPNYKDTSLWRYESSYDGIEDWALIEPGTCDNWVVFLHGHRSKGDQLFTRQDVVDIMLKLLRTQGFGIISPNLRDNAWMCPAAVHDLHELIKQVKETYKVEKTIFYSASMGGTGNLIYSVNHPEDVDVVIAGCPATDLNRYSNWCRERENPAVLSEIAQAIENAYGLFSGNNADIYKKHSTCDNAEKLTMPLYLFHGNNDLIIPVEESRILAEKLASINPAFCYEEIEAGNHDAPLQQNENAVEWLLNQVSC